MPIVGWCSFELQLVGKKTFEHYFLLHLIVISSISLKMNQLEAQAIESSSGSEKGQKSSRKNGNSRGYEGRL
jgi:hypothetical protein